MGGRTGGVRCTGGVLALVALLAVPRVAAGSCASPANEIEAENCLPGAPAAAWELPGPSDASIEGFATDISVNRGETISFKVRTDAPAWRLEIYRLGWYQGNGARLVATVTPSSTPPQAQPACLSDPATGLVDCGNWGVSASWAVPATATSGLHVGKLIREDTGGSSHVAFVVRDDASRSDILFQSSDTTWQAYNDWGGKNLYGCGNWDLSCRAFKVSYNRPFRTRESLGQPENWLFNAEYPLIRWLERNGYDVSYTTATDSDRRGALIQNHRVWISNGHDEYWSGAERANVEAARDAGVHLAFFSSNVMFWKIRREPSIDGTATPYRTLVCYKETHAGAKIDPLPDVWTGTWRDPRFSPPADGGRPENAISGKIFRINAPINEPITVPSWAGRARFWRNTDLADLPPGTVATLAPGTLGDEVDVDWDNGSRPAGLLALSENPLVVSTQYLLDHGSTYGAGSDTHAVTLYRDPSGALVWAAGSYQWAWGLDANHDRSELGATTDARMQQATVNLLADMGVQAATLEAGLAPASPSTDGFAPVSTIDFPLAGADVPVGSATTIRGTASDVGGVVAAVEVSTDDGATWHPASGREAWTYAWTPSGAGIATLRVRAVDDSGNLEVPVSGTTVTVGSGGSCTDCSLWSAAAVPAQPDGGPDSAVEVGVRFRSDVAGWVKGIRFYKASANTGTHVANLWTASGTRLATATFTGETASGWQQVSFPAPVAIQANATYVASYHAPVGHYAADESYFAARAVDSPPLHAPQDGVGGSNGVYAYGATSAFPTQSWRSANYWVDVVFTAAPPATLQSIAVAPADPALDAGATVQLTATGTWSDGTTRSLGAEATWTSSDALVATVDATGLVTGRAPGTATLTAASGAVEGSTVVTVRAAPLAITTASLPDGFLGTPYSATLAAAGGTPPYAWSVSPALPAGLALNAATGAIAGTPTAAGTTSLDATVTDALGQTAQRALTITVSATVEYTLWASAARPSLVDSGPDSAVELGVKFRVDVPGTVKGIRFYKAGTNVGVHTGSLWSSTGTRLATATFVGETASGWQQVLFATPVAVAANTTYVASYFCPSGHYSADLDYFQGTGVDSGPLHAPADGASGPNGVFRYASTSGFPSQGWRASNYWVDVIFDATPPATVTALAVAPSTPTIQAGATQAFAATATYSDGTSRAVTAEASWSSSSVTVATVASTGVATAVAPGSTTITATLSGVAASTTLTVQPAPLAIATAALPDGTLGQPYSATLAATGGTPPYAWTIASGLPPGLALGGATGAISGTPTAVGAYEFGVALTDAGGQSATRLLSVTILSQPTVLTIWPASAAPSLSDAGADAAVTLGVKFRSDVAGRIAGIRFFKSAANGGTHVGSLWTRTGTRLAQATFSGETASGWQTVRFAAPVPIAANTVYVASYHCRNGHYAADLNYFTGAGFDSPPLHALASGVSGVNGVYRYGSTPAFPSQGFNGSNYWVDVQFEPDGPLPTVQSVAVSPQGAELEVGATRQLAATATWSDGSTSDVSASATWSSSDPGVAAVSASGLVTAWNAGTATVSATLDGKSGGAAISVLAGTPPPTEGPGGPILVVTHEGNPFGRYLAEILKAEGLAAYTAMDVSRVTPEVLAAYDVVLLGDFPITADHAATLAEWVGAGGNLVAMRPDPRLATLLGLAPAGGTLSDAYLRVDGTTAPGAGIVGDTIQFHGTADLYALAGATAIATLYSSATAATSAPAVTLRAVGAGSAAAFTYDLARSVVLTRQGNPAWSGQERDGVAPIRSNDLYFGGSAVDWVDLAKVAIPQADEQQRLLANLVLELNAARRPLPRFWYFPSGHKAVVVMTGDDHARGGTRGRFDDYLAASDAGCSVADWECIRSTSYVYPAAILSDAEAAWYEGRGFEIALHVDTGCANWTSSSHLDSIYAGQLAIFADVFPSLAAPATNRTHCIVWSDYDAQPQVELSHGIRLDTTYYFWPGWWIDDRPGFMTGSGIPMRYADRTGRTLDVYQAATQLTDESQQSYPFTVDRLLDAALGPEGYYGAFTANLHTDTVELFESDEVVASAQARGVPVISARQLLEWLDGRDGSSFGEVAWSGGVLSFTVAAAPGARNLEVMVPAAVPGGTLVSVRKDGAIVAHRIETVKGRPYAFVRAPSGVYEVTYR